jgi:D-threonate/D-erythronate kinase
MPETLLAAIADDMTGALEIGALFAARSLRAVVIPAGEVEEWVPRFGDADVLVFDTASRHSDAATAAKRVSLVAAECIRHEVKRLYKKTDSALRGNVGAELAALLTRGAPIFYAPAYPALGRTARGGRLFVNGTRVDQSAFAWDPFEAITDCDIASLLAPHFACPIKIVPPMSHPAPDAECVYVFDGDTGEHVAHVARLVERQSAWIAAGPSGLAAAIAALHGTQRNGELPRAGRTLVINGSLHELARQQIEETIDSGWPVIDEDYEGAVSDWAILRPEYAPPRASLGYAHQRAETVVRLVRRAHIETLVVFGGDTVRAIVEELHSSEIESIDELLPGVALSHIQKEPPGLLLVSKAGGFGDRETLLRIRELLR